MGYSLRKKFLIGELELPVLDTIHYSLLLGDLKVDDRTVKGEVERCTWTDRW